MPEPGPGEGLISLAQASQISGLSHSHLRLLVRQGKIKATKIGRDWLTTEAAVRDYLATERKPGPKTEASPSSDPSLD